MVNLPYVLGPPPSPTSLRVITCSCEIAPRDAGASHILVIFHMHFVKRAKARDETRGSREHEEALSLDTLSRAPCAAKGNGP